MSGQALPDTHVGFGSTSNSLTGSSLFRYSPSAPNDSSILNIEEFNQWTGSYAIDGTAPRYNFSKTFDGGTALSVENKSDGQSAFSSLFIQGQPGSTCEGLSNNNRYMQHTICSPNYTFIPFFANKAVSTSGGGLDGWLHYTDGGSMQFTTKRTGSGLIFNPDIFIQGSPSCGMASGYIGINNNNPQTQLDLDGLLTLRQNTISGRYFMPFIDLDGKVNTNNKVLVNNNAEGPLMLCTFTTSTGQALVQIESGDNTQAATLLLGTYNTNKYGELTYIYPGYTSDPYPFLPTSTVLWNRGGPMNIGTYDNYDISIFRNQAEKIKLTSTSAQFSVNIESTKGLSLAYSSKSSNYTVQEDDYTINCTAEITINLPSCAVLPVGKVYVVKNSSINIVTVDAYGSQTIDDVLVRIVSAPYGRVTLQNTGTAWIILN